jgi:hypothetical protein
MNLITKYKQYLLLLESKKPDFILKNNRNGLDFYLIDENLYDLFHINRNFSIEKYEKIKSKIKFSSYFLKSYVFWKDNTKLDSYIDLNLFENTSDDVNYGNVIIHSLIKDEEYSIDHYDYYLLKFYLENDEAIYYICDDWYGIKRCIIYNVLYNDYYDSQIFYDEILNLLKPNQVKELMENADYNKIVWYNNPSYIKYGLSNDLVDLNKINYLSNLWYLVENSILSKKDFVNKHPNSFLLKDNDVYIRYTKGDLTDLSFMFSEDDSTNHNTNSRDFVENLNENSFYRESTSFDDLYLDYLKPESIKLIEDKIEEIKSKLSIEDQEEFDEYDDWEDKVKNIDSLNNIKDAIETAFNYAQESADSDDMYEAVEKPILSLFGMEKLERDENDHYIFLLKKDFLIRFDNYFTYLYLKEYKKIINEEIIDKWFEIVQENDDSVEFLKINFPYYGFDGSIDKAYLHECVEEKLAEI